MPDETVSTAQAFWRAKCANIIGILGMPALQPYVDGLYHLAYDPFDEPRRHGFGLARRRLTCQQPVFKADGSQAPRLGCLVGGWVDPASEAWLDLPIGTGTLWFAMTGAMTPFEVCGVGEGTLEVFPPPPSHHEFRLGYGAGDGERAIAAVSMPFSINGDKSVWEAGGDIVVQARRFRIGGAVPFFAIGMCYVEFIETAVGS